MAFPSIFTQAQLEMAAGGADKLLQLVDKTGSGDLASTGCQAFITEIQSAAIGEVYAILQIAFDPADTVVQGSSFVQLHGVTIGLYWAWHKSTGGVAIPDEVIAAHDRALTALEKAAEGLRTLATSTQPTSNTGQKIVSLDSPTGQRILRRNMGGFC